MDCMTFQKLIPAYINEQLDDSTLNEFLIHLRNCPHCSEELEIHYIVMKGVDILDSDIDDYNLSAKFTGAVRESTDYLKKKKRLVRLEYVIDSIALWSILASLILFINKYLPG